MMKNMYKTVRSIFILFAIPCFAFCALAQDGTIYPLDAPKEPNAIPLGTGSVKDQPAPETWFRQWGDPMARNISQATLTPFFPEKEKPMGLLSLWLPAGDTVGFPWGMKVGK